GYILYHHKSLNHKGFRFYCGFYLYFQGSIFLINECDFNLKRALEGIIHLCHLPYIVLSSYGLVPSTQSKETVSKWGEKDKHVPRQVTKQIKSSW
ncbi:MAG: hypothetical protein ACUVWV_15700, partial [Thermodesulfobacteriota bacterium]